MREKVLLASAVLAMFASITSAVFSYQAKTAGDSITITPASDGFELTDPGMVKALDVGFRRNMVRSRKR